jgi:hypothetical protein
MAKKDRKLVLGVQLIRLDENSFLSINGAASAKEK